MYSFSSDATKSTTNLEAKNNLHLLIYSSVGQNNPHLFIYGSVSLACISLG